MNKALALAYEVEKVLDKFGEDDFEKVLSKVPEKWRDSQYIASLSKPGSLYCKWLYCLVKYAKPGQVVELGGAQGVSTLFMSEAMIPGSSLISVDLIDDWRVLPADSSVLKVIGRSEDTTIYPKEINLGKTDIWFIDTDHYQEQLQKEFDAYSQYWREGTIIVLDDIDYYDARPQHDLYKFWPAIKYDKVSLPHLHVSGFGLIAV